MLGQASLENIWISVSCFLEDVARLQKLKENSLDGSRVFPGVRFLLFMSVGFAGLWNCKKSTSRTWKYERQNLKLQKSKASHHLEQSMWLCLEKCDLECRTQSSRRDFQASTLTFKPVLINRRTKVTN